MKFLLLNQFFWPDNSATSQLLTDLAAALIVQGHEVTAICSVKGYVAARAGKDAPNVKVYRVKALPFVRGVMGRVLSYLSFYLSAAWHSFTLTPPDVVLTLTTPPLLPVLGTLLKTLKGTRHFIWEMDVYPDVAVDLNYFKADGFLDKVVGTLADYSRRRADGIIALGDCMKERLVRRGIPADRIWIAHNWADSNAIHPQPRPGDPNQLVLLYSGNMGLAHDFGTLFRSIESLRDDDRFLFLFRGSGARKQEVADFAQSSCLQSIVLSSFVARESLSDSLAAGDIGVVTQREICCGSVVPSKVYGLLAAGRPILFIGPFDATPARIIREFDCGWHIRPGDSEGLSTLLSHLVNHREEVTSAGSRARAALITHFDRAHGTGRILSILEGKLSSYPNNLSASPATFASIDPDLLT